MAMRSGLEPLILEGIAPDAKPHRRGAVGEPGQRNLPPVFVEPFAIGARRRLRTYGVIKADNRSLRRERGKKPGRTQEEQSTGIVGSTAKR